MGDGGERIGQFFGWPVWGIEAERAGRNAAVRQAAGPSCPARGASVGVPPGSGGEVGDYPGGSGAPRRLSQTCTLRRPERPTCTTPETGRALPALASSGLREEAGHRLHPAINVVALVRVGIVCAGQVGQHDPLDPLHVLEAVSPPAR